MEDDIFDGLCALETSLVDLSQELRRAADDGNLLELSKIAHNLKIAAAAVEIYVATQKTRDGK